MLVACCFGGMVLRSTETDLPIFMAMNVTLIQSSPFRTGAPLGWAFHNIGPLKLHYQR
jgi:hypothetical protein